MYEVKNIIAAVLFVCILVPVVTPVCLQIKQLYLQHEMLEKMEKTALTSIRVKSDNIQWIKPGKECMIAGEMFDVKQIKQEGNVLVLTGLFDEQEQQIRKQLQAQTKQQQNNNKQQMKWSKMLQLLAVIHAGVAVDMSPVLYNNQETTDYFTLCYNSPFQTIPSPPPKNCIRLFV